MRRFNVHTLTLVLLLVALAVSGSAAGEFNGLNNADAKVRLDRTGQVSHGKGDCQWLDYHCNVDLENIYTIPNGWGGDFFNMRFSPESPCTLKTIEMTLYDSYPEFSDTSGLGIDVLIWNDDGFGFPGGLVHTVNVPSAELVYSPSVLSIDVESAGLVFNDDFHIGYTTVDQMNDNFAVLADDGTCGDLRSSCYYMRGIWETMIDHFGADINFLMAAEVCKISENGDCQWLDYHCNVDLENIYPIPNDWDCDFFNMRFSPESPCTLKTIEMTLYDSYPEFSDTSGLGIDVLIWNDDGFGFPGGLVHTVNVPSAELVYSPSVLSIDVESAGLVFNDDFHIGYTTVDQMNDNFAVLADDGTCGDLRSSLYYGIWETMIDHFGADINFLMAAEVCKISENGDCACVTAPDSMVAWFPFDETAGPTANNASTGNDGTHVNNPTIEPGKVQNSLCFNGSNSYVEVPSYPTIEIGTSDFTIDAWIKRSPDDNDETRIIVDKRADAAGDNVGYSFYLYQGKLGLQMSTQSQSFYNWVSAAYVTKDVWHHVAVTVDRDETNGMHFYLDGTLILPEYDPTIRDGSLSNEFPLRVSSRSYEVSGVFYGCIDEVEVFNRALDAQEIYGIWWADECGKCKYITGDADGSGGVDIDDVVYVIAYIFSGGTEPIPYESGDTDCSGAVDIDDVVYLINYIFSGGPPPGETCP